MFANVAKKQNNVEIRRQKTHDKKCNDRFCSQAHAITEKKVLLHYAFAFLLIFDLVVIPCSTQSSVP